MKKKIYTYILQSEKKTYFISKLFVSYWNKQSRKDNGKCKNRPRIQHKMLTDAQYQMKSSDSSDSYSQPNVLLEKNKIGPFLKLCEELSMPYSRLVQIRQPLFKISSLCIMSVIRVTEEHLHRIIHPFYKGYKARKEGGSLLLGLCASMLA